MTKLSRKAAIALIVATMADDVDDHQITMNGITAIPGGSRIEFSVDGVGRNDEELFSLDPAESASHTLGDEGGTTNYAYWARYLPDEGTNGRNIVVALTHRCGEYSDDETDADADVVMMVVDDSGIENAVEIGRRLWSSYIVKTSIEKLGEVLKDAETMSDSDLLMLFESDEYQSLNRRIAQIVS